MTPCDSGNEALRGACGRLPAAWGGEEFHRFLDDLPAGAYTCDAGGLITYYNRRALDMWGRAPKLNDPLDRY